MSSVELQINIHPNDWRYFRLMATHQIRKLSGQIDGVRLTLDLHNSFSGRYRSSQYELNTSAIKEEINSLQQCFPNVICEEVDYSPQTKKQVAKFFFNLQTIPDKAWDGGPFYSYLYGIWSSKLDYVIHIDSDMFFGGSSLSWVKEALTLLNSDSRLVFVSPLSGPPHPDGFLFGHHLQGNMPILKHGLPNAYLFQSVSTRIFLTSKKLIAEKFGVMDMVRPGVIMRVKAFLLGNSASARELEVIFSKNLQKRDLYRMDFLGSKGGMWSLHPPFRSEMFYRKLANLISDIENDFVPITQFGKYDIVDDLVDWSDQRRHRKIKNLFKQLKAVLRLY